MSAPANLFSFAVSWTNLVNEVPVWADRLRGVRGIRATLVFRVEHNANPFHQGLLVSSFQYGANQFFRGDKPAMCTHLPHVRLNLSENTACVLKVPFLSDLEYIGSSTSEVNHVHGRYSLAQVLGTPSLAGSSTPVYKLYLSLEDIELFGTMPLAGTTFIVPQSGVAPSKVKGTSNSEAELKANGQFSGVLATAAELPKAVGRAFPSLRPFMGSVSWFLNASAKAASAFGFSKPVATSALERIVKFPNNGDTCVDLPAPATVVGAFLSNSVAVSPVVGGTDLDEMAFDTILTRYSQVFRGSLSTTDAHAAVRYCSHVALTHMWFRTATAADAGNVQLPRNSATETCFFPSTLLYFGQHFRFWTGGFKYRVTFSKSKFHTGRVMFSFVPNYRQISNVSTYFDVASEGGPVPGVFNSDLQPSQYSLVFDLKDGNEFEFEVPYIAPTSYLGINDSMGFVSMQVMDPLVTSGETSSTINFIVEVAALPGFHFAGITGAGQPAWTDNLNPSITFQSGVGAISKDASQYTVGEKFCSAKQLAMLPILRRFDQSNGSLVTGLVPSWVDNAAWGPGTGALAANTTREMPFSRSGMVAQCYAFATGSSLLWTEATGLGRGSSFRVVCNRGDNGAAPSTVFPGFYNQASTVPSSALSYSSRDGGSGVFLLPTLATTPRFRPGDFCSPTGGARDFGPSVGVALTTSQGAKTRYSFAVRNTDGASATWFWGVSAADDARAAAYIGPCPLILASGTYTTASWYTPNPI